jgi:hypothetical protein
MNAIEVKSNLHQLIDNIQNINLLNSILEVLNNTQNQKEGELWSSLSESQKSEVIAAYNESEDESTLIKSKDVLRKIL